MGLYKRGKNWYIDYGYADRRIREVGGPVKDEARVLLSILIQCRSSEGANAHL